MNIITAALPYANGPIHIGHLAGVYLPADIYVRYLRSKGEEVIFVSGSDEHGAAITIRAKKENISPQEIVDKYHFLNKTSFEKFGISFDIFSRTSNKIHHDVASNFFLNLYNKGLLEKHETEQYYDTQENTFLADRYIIGTCPKCNNDSAYGDQCENCGSTLSPDELINPKSTISGKPPIIKKTTHWYLPLNKYQNWLKKWIIEEHKIDWKSNVYGQCKSWLDDGLRPRAITRDLDWGVTVPLEEAKGKVLYVWFDAPIGYISATQEWAKENNKDWKDIWQNNKTNLIHFVGKDNIVFHCIIFPTMLKAHGDYILPKNIPANEFMNLEGKKLSTSKNWAVWLTDYLKKFPDKQDILRYVLCANTPETKDSDFTWEDFKNRNNNELVGILGNFINRTLILTHKYFKGIVPTKKELTIIDKEVIRKIIEFPKKIENSILKFKFREALAQWIDLARTGNKYLAETEPWKSDDENRKKTIINISLQIVANISILGIPFIPFTCKKLQKMIKIKETSWASAETINLLKGDHVIESPSLLFQKIEAKDLPKFYNS